MQAQSLGDVIIVSIFGRGDWLASEMSRKGFQVQLVDVSPSMGRWAPEDWEGPFGFFHSANLNETQVAQLFEGESVVKIPSGFCLWTEDGPLEFTSPLFRFQQQKGRLSDNADDYLKNYNNFTAAQIAHEKEKLAQTSFRNAWPAYFAHQISSSVFCDYRDSMNWGKPLPLHSNYFVKRSSRLGRENSLEECERQGVKVYSEAGIKDVSLQNGSFQGLEVTIGGSTTFLNAKNMIWMLSTFEMESLSSSLKKKFAFDKVIEPEWGWARFRVSLEANHVSKALPLQFVIVKDVNLPWVNSNVIWCIRTTKETEYDTWMRIPHSHRFQAQYMEMLKQEMLEILRARLPGTGILEVVMPQDFYYGFKELGAPRFPVYNLQELKAFKRPKYKNIIWDGPENWKRLDWLSIMDTHKVYVENFIQAREKEEKENARKV